MAGRGEGGGGVLKGRQAVLVFAMTTSLLTALELLPELGNLLEEERKRRRRGRGGGEEEEEE